MGKKPLQFQVPERFKQEIEDWVQEKDMTVSDFLRQSSRVYIILRNYIDQGYSLVLKKEDGAPEKEIIFT